MFDRLKIQKCSYCGETSWWSAPKCKCELYSKKLKEVARRDNSTVADDWPTNNVYTSSTNLNTFESNSSFSGGGGSSGGGGASGSWSSDSGTSSSSYDSSSSSSCDSGGGGGGGD